MASTFSSAAMKNNQNFEEENVDRPSKFIHLRNPVRR
jgi:hypothetical protein